MKKNEIESVIEELKLPIELFDIKKIKFQLSQLDKKIKRVKALPVLMDYSPQFTLNQSCDEYDK